MKKYVKLRTFLSGMLAAVLLLGCGTAALAAGGGNISIGSTGILIHRQSVIRPGEKITNANGKEIPSALVYTDEAGGDNTYLPIRAISEMLNIPVTWKDGSVYLGLAPVTEAAPTTVTVFDPSDPNSAPSSFSTITETTRVGAKAGPFTEVEPYWSEDYSSNAAGAILGDIHMRKTGGIDGAIDTLMEKGGYYSVSITNNTQYPLYLSLSSEATITVDAFRRTVIPAGETVVRTFKVDACESALGLPKLGYDILFDNHKVSPREEADITLSARGFKM